ncbi:fibrinogen-like YCDxxxxGGGW domain-containing protein [Spirillospora sp. CA-142024]|uniref:fibrinogen-like YCDxxxxGGGW domain-containing protein n=1 Tax=Spirillospora sp. CA-142024 TaxID=3240036 RepID=UPI003D8DFE2C
MTIVATAAVLTGTVVATVSAQGGGRTAALSAASVQRDGKSSARAAASCWAIKQQFPSSADGVYWLQTPKLVAPDQFYCDMTTDGGGWVLAGRGRQGWNFAYPGQNGVAEVRSNPTGTGAFTPATLPAETIDGLLGGHTVDDLPDGVRVRRATNVDGSKWQEMRWKFQKAAPWSWTFDADPANPLTSVSFDGATSSGGNTRLVAKDSVLKPTNGFYTYETKENSWQRGFAYRSYVTAGDNSPTSYLWRSGVAGGNTIPFTQVWIRPKLTDLEYPSVPDSGTPATTEKPLMKNQTSGGAWGVTGVVSGGTGEKHLEVQAMAVSGNTMYVGGEFKYVQKGATPAADEKVEQSYLAAFDTTTGEWKSSFRPKLNGGVWDLEVAGNKLIVAGEFTKANDAGNTAGLAALDLATGKNATGWAASVSASDGSPAMARALDVQGNWLYVGGSFTRIWGGNPLSTKVSVGRTARLRLSDGKPDGTWKPNFNGSVIELDANPGGDRVYYAGYFTQVNGQPARKIAVLGTAAPAAQVAGLNDQSWHPSTPNIDKQYQQIIREYGDKVWVGGSEHIFSAYTKSKFDRIKSVITKPGGDMQAAVEINGIVYGSCHCYKFVYHDGDAWPTPTTWSQIQTANAVMAFDGKTAEPMSDFWPSLGTRAGNGPWELTEDKQGCMWIGGDINRGSWLNSGYQWAGGFTRVCQRDTSPPGKPTDLKATSEGGGVKLTWQGPSANANTAKYEVIKDDRVIGVTWGWHLTDDSGTGGRYWVRAVDTAGNRSASTEVVTP